MPYRPLESEDAIVLAPDRAPVASVIWLHGLGADGYDFVPIVEELRLPASTPVRFVFPHAAMRPVTINNGFVMRAWYDILSLGPARDRGRTEDEAGVQESADAISRFVAAEAAAGVAEDRIVLAGFSQGGAMALHTALRHPRRLAGIMALSAYLPLQSQLAGEASPANRETPLLMCHGLRDGVVPLALGAGARDELQRLGYRVEWRTYPMDHQVSMEEIADISAWLQRVLG
jgi:phospholipase/carboxylesterase